MWVYLQIAARNLLQARRRTALLGLALMFVTMLLVLLQALSAGIADSMKTSATTLSTGHLNVAGWYKTKPTDSAPVVMDKATVRRTAEEILAKDIDYVIDRHRGFGKLVSDTGSTISGFTGVDPLQEERLKKTLVLAKESDYVEGGSEDRKGDLTKLGQPGTIVVFANIAKRIGVRVGDSLTMTSQSFTGIANSAEATVVAVAEDIGLLSSFSNFVNTKTILDLYQLKDTTTGAVQVYLKDIEDSKRALGVLRKGFEARGFLLTPHEEQPFFAKFETIQNEDWTGQKLDITMWSDEVSFLASIIVGIDVVSFFLIAILVIIIVIGIMNTMWISVRERTGEIGTLRAIGMGQGRVLLMFLLEALILGAFAAAGGVLAGSLLAVFLDALQLRIPFEPMRLILLSDRLHMVVTIQSLLGALALFTGVAGVSALFPAYRAAKMPPVTAIQAVM